MGARLLLEEVVRLAETKPVLDGPGRLHLGLGLVTLATERDREATLHRTEVIGEGQIAPVHDPVVAGGVTLDLAIVAPARGHRAETEGEPLPQVEHETDGTLEVPADTVCTTTETTVDLQPGALGADREDRADHAVVGRVLAVGDGVPLDEGAEGEPAELGARVTVADSVVDPAIRELHLVGAAVVVQEVVIDLRLRRALVDVVADAVVVHVDVDRLGGRAVTLPDAVAQLGVEVGPVCPTIADLRRVALVEADFDDLVLAVAREDHGLAVDHPGRGRGRGGGGDTFLRHGLLGRDGEEDAENGHEEQVAHLI